jgi:ABC-type lipoprotein export system ATPase subunit
MEDRMSDRPTIEDLPGRGPGIVDLPGAAPQPAPRAPTSATRPPKRRYGEGALIVCDNLVRIFKVADLEVVALQGLDLLVADGEMIAVVGASGSGKSTLLNILGGLDTPSAGRAVVAGHDLGRMGRRERTAYRRRVVGVVWQQTARNLLPYLSAVENVELPMVLDGKAARRRRARELLDLVGLAPRAAHRPERLSGGEQQRVAIAVALANEPSVILADEPTGELDSQTSAEVFALLRRVNAELGTTIVSVTHDPLVADHVQRTVAIRDGRTSSETVRRTELTDDGHRVISEEFAVLDRAGRLQLPKTHIESLHLADRVRLRLEEDHVGVWPDGRPGAPPVADRRPADEPGESEAGRADVSQPQDDRAPVHGGASTPERAAAPTAAPAAELVAEPAAEPAPPAAEPAPPADLRYRRPDAEGRR